MVTENDITHLEQQIRLRNALRSSSLVITEKEIMLLNVLASNPGATAEHLSQKCGYRRHPAGWNGQFGSFCKRLEPRLWVAPDSIDRKGERFFSGLLTDGGGHTFTLKGHLEVIFREEGLIR